MVTNRKKKINDEKQEHRHDLIYDLARGVFLCLVAFWLNGTKQEDFNSIYFSGKQINKDSKMREWVHELMYTSKRIDEMILGEYLKNFCSGG